MREAGLVCSPSRAALPDAAVAWVERAAGPGARVLAAQPLLGGLTSQVTGLLVQAGPRTRTLVLRRFAPPIAAAEAEAMVRREALALGLLAGTDIPAPRLVAVDPRSDGGVGPALLMTRLPGRVVFDDAGSVARGALLAAALLAIHRVEPPPGARPPTYTHWLPDPLEVPAWSSRPDVWERAIVLAAAPPPPHRPCLLHRDFHPGNVLFDGAGTAVSGVVDWVETSWGPPDLDLAHCRSNLTMLHGPEAAAALRTAYRARGGSLAEEPARRAYWEVLDALSFLPDPAAVAAPWRALGRDDLVASVVRLRLEEAVARSVARGSDPLR